MATKKNVFLYPGQGAQFKGMIKDLCETKSEAGVAAMDVVMLAEKISGEPVRDYLWNTEAPELARSDRSQLAITTASLALTAALKVQGIEGDVFAGFSLGEFAALCSSGVVSIEDALKMVYKRGKIMQAVCDEIQTAAVKSGLALAADGAGESNAPGMSAVIGLTPEKVCEVLKMLNSGNVFAANLNSPKQTVIAGTSTDLAKAEEKLKEAGARRIVRLKVAGPFHSPLMQKAADLFKEVLVEVEFKNPAKTILSNVTGDVVTDADEIKRNLLLHFTHPVLWTSEEMKISKLIEADKTDVAENWKIFEVGPGNVLGGLWRDSGYAENISCESAEKIFEAVKS